VALRLGRIPPEKKDNEHESNGRDEEGTVAPDGVERLMLVYQKSKSAFHGDVVDKSGERTKGNGAKPRQDPYHHGKDVKGPFESKELGNVHQVTRTTNY